MIQIVWLTLIQVSVSLSYNDFLPSFFSSSQPSSFYSIVTGNPLSGTILSLSDLNGDFYTDTLSLPSSSSYSLMASYWNGNQFLTQLWQLPSTNGNINQVCVTQLDNDPSNQIIVIYDNIINASTIYTAQIYDITCASQYSCSIELKQLNYTALTGMVAPPFVFDAFSDGSHSLLIFPSHTDRYILSVPAMELTAFKAMVSPPPNAFASISMHFASIVDLDGDCYSDLIIFEDNGSTTNMRVYLRGGASSVSKWVDAGTVTMAGQVKSARWADIDADGDVDLVIAIPSNSNNKTRFQLNALINPNMPSSICRAANPFIMLKEISTLSLLPTNVSMLNASFQLGDFNFDGLPDFIGTCMVNRQVHVWLIDRYMYGQQIGIISTGSLRMSSILWNNGDYTFRVGGSQVEQIQKIAAVRQVAIFDIGQDGKLDLLIMGDVVLQDGTTAIARQAIFNNLIQDSLFVKILPLQYDSGIPPYYNKTHVYDISCVVASRGVTIQWRITTLSGSKQISVAGQGVQSNYNALSLPFATAGLGRTNNYIQDLTVGYQQSASIMAWTPIVPNSQLVVYGGGATARLEMLLKDNSRVYQVLYISILVLAVMGIGIFILNWRENREDKRDHYNFIQMIR